MNKYFVHLVLFTGEGMAVAVNIILRNILEEMSTAEHLWASHSAGSTTATR